MLGVDLTAAWRPRVGMVTVALDLARALRRRGMPLTLFFSRERLPGFDADRAVLSPYRHELANKLWLRSVEAQAGVRAMLYPYWPPPPRRRAGAPPAITFVHDLAFRLRPREVPWQQRLYLGSVLPAALESSALVLTPTDVTRCDLLQEYPIAGLDGRVEVLHEGVPDLPAGGGLPAGIQPGFILAVGTVEARKNYPRLVEAYRRLEGAPPLVIAGKPGWGRGAELPEAPNVFPIGHVDDASLRALYENARLLAFPSLYEGFGLPLLEAMSFGVPAVIGRAGALPELAGGAAIEVDAESVEDIAAGLRRGLDDPGDLAQRGRRRAAEFTWDAAAERLEALIGRITA